MLMISLLSFADLYVNSVQTGFGALLIRALFLFLGLYLVVKVRASQGFYIRSDSPDGGTTIVLTVQTFFAHLLALGLLESIVFLKNLIDWEFGENPQLNLKPVHLSLLCIIIERIYRYSRFGGTPIWRKK